MNDIIGIDLLEKCKKLLTKNKIKFDDTLRLEQSLPYSLPNKVKKSGEINFIGVFEWKKYVIRITHTWKYEYFTCVYLIITNKKSKKSEMTIENDKINKEFRNIYSNICNELEKNKGG